MPVGVSLTFSTDAQELAFEVQLGIVVLQGNTPRFATMVLEVDGVLHASEPLDGDHWVVDPADMSRIELVAGRRQIARFTDLPPGMKNCRLWLPHNAITNLHGLHLTDGCCFFEVPDHSAPKWIHYGSSISQCFDARLPTDAWPVAVARRAGLDLLCLSMPGECHLDAFVARTMAQQPAELFSMKVGINIVAEASFNRRTLVATLNNFLDIVREQHPETPIVLISPIHCMSPVGHPVDRRRTVRFGRSRPQKPVRPGRLTIQAVRDELQALVVERGQRDSHLYFLDGRRLLGPEDEANLPDGVHPNQVGYSEMALRFEVELEQLGLLFQTLDERGLAAG